jgi:hypothetical protein
MPAVASTISTTFSVEGSSEASMAAPGGRRGAAGPGP